jgi:hypothetical protein
MPSVGKKDDARRVNMVNDVDKVRVRIDGDVDVVTVVTVCKPPAAGSPQSRDCPEAEEEGQKWPMGPHQEASGWLGPHRSVCL